MIIITGGAGFIGSNLLKALNNKNLDNILVVEELDRFEEKFNNLENMDFIDCIDKNIFLADDSTTFSRSLKTLLYFFE